MAAGAMLMYLRCNLSWDCRLHKHSALSTLASPWEMHISTRVLLCFCQHAALLQHYTEHHLCARRVDEPQRHSAEPRQDDKLQIHII